MVSFKTSLQTDRSRKDSVISLSFRPKARLKAESKDTGLSPPPPGFTVPMPSTATPATPYPGPRLVKKSTVNPQKQKKTLHELVTKACEASCTLILRRSLKSEGINLLLTDPAAVDFLLVCVGCSRDSSLTGAKVLPGKCPVNEKKLPGVVREMPSLSSKDAKPKGKIKGTISTKHSADALLARLTNTHLTLLRYLVHSPFAHVSSVSPKHHPDLVFPTVTMLTSQTITPHTFLIARQPLQKDALFRAHASRPNHTRVTVFHGTHPCRLPLILSQGLRNMSGTRFQKHGKCLGPGIYLAKEAQTALGYAYAVEPWKESSFRKVSGSDKSAPLSQVKVLLGCEVVVPKDKQHEGIIVEKDEGEHSIEML